MDRKQCLHVVRIGVSVVALGLVAACGGGGGGSSASDLVAIAADACHPDVATPSVQCTLPEDSPKGVESCEQLAEGRTWGGQVIGGLVTDSERSRNLSCVYATSVLTVSLLPEGQEVPADLCQGIPSRGVAQCGVLDGVMVAQAGSQRPILLVRKGHIGAELQGEAAFDAPAALVELADRVLGAELDRDAVSKLVAAKP